MPKVVKCNNFDCENSLGPKYFAIMRIIAKGNKRRRWTFCSIKCILNFLGKWSSKEEKK